MSHRVDALTLAYRVRLAPGFVAELHARAAVAAKYGRADLRWSVWLAHPPASSRRPSLSALFDEQRGKDVMIATPPWALRDAIEDFGTDAARVVSGAAAPSDAREPVAMIIGELRHNDRRGIFDVATDRYFRMRVKLHGDGAWEETNEVTGETTKHPGFTVEIVWRAQRIAEWGEERVIRESRAMAWMLGDVEEERLRRIDVCADVAGWEILPDDVDRIVKRPRALKDIARDATEIDALGMRHVDGCRCRKCGPPELGDLAGPVSYETGKPGARKVCGISVGRGGATQMRIYDKRLELAYVNTHTNEEGCVCRRCEEHARWRDGGWDGEAPVTRVEFQIRGEALSELGLRNPDACLDVESMRALTGSKRVAPREIIVGQRIAANEDGEVLRLVDRLPWLWATMLDWARIIVPDPKQKTTTRLEDDPRWALLRSIEWGAARPMPLRRYRARRAASEAQAIGVALSQAAKAGELAAIVGAIESETSPRLMSEDAAAYGSRDDAADRMREIVERLFADQARRAYAYLVARGHGNPIDGMLYFATRVNASSARFFDWRGVADAVKAIVAAEDEMRAARTKRRRVSARPLLAVVA